MDARSRMRWFQTASRGWLTLAALSLLLSPADRGGQWLPLHLTLAGAASAAIGGAMPWFVAALTATPEPSRASFFTRFYATNVGVAAMGLAVLVGPRWLLPLGGTLFILGHLQLGALLVTSRRRSLHRRHGVPIALYGAAVAAVVVGASLGALLGAGVFDVADAYLAARRAHLSLNIVGWLSLTIAGSLATFLPTVLRVRIPPWPSRATAIALIAGVAVLAIGMISSLPILVMLGAVGTVSGTAGLGVLAARALSAARAQRGTPLPLAAMHLIAGLVWFVVGMVILAIAVAGGVDGVDAARDPLLSVLVLGWVVQVLMGAWSYLLPTVRPGHPDARRRMYAVMEVGARSQVVVWNLGVAILASAPTGGTASLIGWSAVLGVTVVGLVKVWAFAPMSRLPLPAGAFRAWSASDGGLRA